MKTKSSKWSRRYALGVMDCWEKNGNILTITKRDNWDVEINRKMIGSHPCLEKARFIAKNYMRNH